MQSLAFTYSQQPGELRLRKKKTFVSDSLAHKPRSNVMHAPGGLQDWGENLSARSKNLLVILKVLKADSYA